MAPIDFKKKYKDLYLPKKEPSIVEVPKMLFVMVDGKGDPNTSKEYKEAIEILYGISYTIKMSKKGDRVPVGFYDYVVPPLEGLWTVDDLNYKGGPIQDKGKFLWTAMIRQPEFVSQEVFDDAKRILGKKKPELDLSKVRLETMTEGLCAQVMHTGPFDDEASTIQKLVKFVRESGYREDINEVRRHHEIYLSDPRKTSPDKLKTVIRHPIVFNND